MIRSFTILLATVALAACGTDRSNEGDEAATQEQAEAAQADPFASNDEASAEELSQGIADSQVRPMMQAQVVLDRRGFTPGVVDGKMGMSTENALMGFQEANDLEQTGELDEATRQALAQWERIPATRVVTIPDDWGQGDYVEIPEEPEAKAEMERLGYTSLDEKLAERFHTTVEVLKELNPNGRPAGADMAGTPGGTPATGTPSPSPSTTSPSPTPSASSTGEAAATAFFRPDQQVRVPNVGNDRIADGAVDDADWRQTLVSLGIGTEQPEVDRVVVSKAGKTLKAYSGEKLVAMYTVSSGSSEFPLPLGNWDIVGKAYNPPYQYDPEVLGQSGGETFTFPPGPNGPVGVVWIDLSKEHYGIHGTPDPETIGRAQSSGCVRLTNWDAARLAQMVSQSTKVEFVA